MYNMLVCLVALHTYNLYKWYSPARIMCDCACGTVSCQGLDQYSIMWVGLISLQYYSFIIISNLLCGVGVVFELNDRAMVINRV